MRYRDTLTLAVAVLSISSQAVANGRYPASNLVAFDPSDANHIVIVATFGLLETRDGGGTFGWRCESAMGTISPQDTVVAVTGSGATIAGRFDGLAESPDGCSFVSVPELAGKAISDLTLSPSAPHSPIGFYSEPGEAGLPSAHIVRSDDDGRTWKDVGRPLSSSIHPLTIDVAPSDPSRVYVSALTGADRDYATMLLRSSDAGATFESTEIPETAGYHVAWIAAVHPIDADRIYLRVQEAVGTTIWTSVDGGKAFQKIFSGEGPLLGFAISPDGMQMAVGGPTDGIWVGHADGINLQHRSDIAPTCLGWSTAGLFACADGKTAGFSIGRSRDSGATFEGLLRFDELCGGQTTCGSATSVAMKCPAEWETVGKTLGSTCGFDAGSGEPRAGDADRDGEVTDARSGPIDATSTGEDGAGRTGSEPGPPLVESSATSCSMVNAHRSALPCTTALGALLLISCGVRTRRRRERR